MYSLRHPVVSSIGYGRKLFIRSLMVTSCLLFSAAAPAQTTSNDPQVSRILPNTATISSTLEATTPNRSTTLAGGVRKGDAQVSRNEAYNLSRAASGRLGVRLGNDMSFRVK